MVVNFQGQNNLNSATSADTSNGGILQTTVTRNRQLSGPLQNSLHQVSGPLQTLMLSNRNTGLNVNQTVGMVSNQNQLVMNNRPSQNHLSQMSQVPSNQIRVNPENSFVQGVPSNVQLPPPPSSISQPSLVPQQPQASPQQQPPRNSSNNGGMGGGQSLLQQLLSE